MLQSGVITRAEYSQKVQVLSKNQDKIFDCLMQQRGRLDQGRAMNKLEAELGIVKEQVREVVYANDILREEEQNKTVNGRLARSLIRKIHDERKNRE